jgi:RNA polymerase sigma factor (sigma-70 family)
VKPPLRRLACAVLIGAALAAQADEVFQDVWMRVVRQHGDFAPRDGGRAGATAAFRTWLYTLAHHRALDALRRSGRETALPEDDDGAPFQPEASPWLDWPNADAAGHDEALFWRRAGERLLACLDQLPAGQRAVFLLHHDDGQTLADVAQAMQLGFETARSRLRYAMARLRVCMGAYLPAPAQGSES